MAEIIYIVGLYTIWKPRLLADLMLLMLQALKYDFYHEKQICCVLLFLKLCNMIFVRGSFFCQVADSNI